jgi:putative oxidoreductase
MNKLFQLSFVPRSTDFALLVLRFWLGLTLLFNHGIGKLLHFSQVAPMMPDPLGVGAHLNLALVVIAEVLCSALVVIGFATRFAALIVVIEMLVAFTMVHHRALATGPGSGELAFLYLAGFLTIVLAGGGRFVVCNKTNAPAAPAS